MFRSLCLLLVSAARLAAQPSVSAVENAASNIDPRMPNGAIGQGAIFVLYGKGLGPANTVIAPAAFQSTTLSTTSVSVTMGSTNISAPLYYTSAGQVAALLPSSTPTGTGSISVTYNNQTSAKLPITVVASNPGIFTIDSTGTGPAVVTYPDYSLVSPFKAANCGGPNTTCGAANPGDVLILWATGLGPITGSDASGAGLGQNMPAVPVKVWLGGVQAQITYQGRSGCCIGEDQIVFTVPNNVPAACAVPLVIQIDNQVSNSTVIPIANGTRTCAETTTPGVDVSQIATLSSFSFANVELDHFINDAGTGFVDKAAAFAAKVSGLSPVTRAFWGSFLDAPAVGTCTVFGARAPSDVFFNNLVSNGNVSLLDSGSTFTITGPKGTVNFQSGAGDSTVINASGAFLVPGDYTITGAGGRDVGPFTAHITIAPTPTLTSPNLSNLTITRSKGMTFTWNPNGSTGHVEIVIASFLDQNTAAQASCSAPAAAGTMTIPPYVLMALPATNNANLWFQPGDQAPAYVSGFTAPGLTAGIAQAFVDGIVTGNVKLN